MRNKGFTLIELLIVVAIIAILAAIAVPNFLEAQTRSKVSRAKADFRSLATAIESYLIDNNVYPAVDSSSEAGGTGTSGFGVNNFERASANALASPSFRRKANEIDVLSTLTTPVAYIASLPGDIFSKSGKVFAYSTPSLGLDRDTRQAGWILWSYGPDFDETVGIGGDIAYSTGEQPRVDTAYYNPRQQIPSPTLIDQATYDPTNGTNSNGDVYRTKD